MKTFPKAKALQLVRYAGNSTAEFLGRVGNKKEYTEKELLGWAMLETYETACEE